VRCAYYDSGVCRSCTLIEVPHATQIATKQAHLEGLIGRPVDWLPPLVSAESGFRAKAKMVVGGTVDSSHGGHPSTPRAAASTCATAPSTHPA